MVWGLLGLGLALRDLTVPPPFVRALISILAAVAAVVLMTIAAKFASDVPPACHIPGHTYTTVYECEEQ